MDNIDLLIKSISEENLSVFIGAAISYKEPSCVPSWYGFRDSVITNITRELIDKSNSPFQKSIDKILKSNLKPEVVLEGIDRFSSGMSKVVNFVKSFDSGYPNEYHIVLAELLLKKKINNIYTTNWDSFIEDSIGSEDKVNILTHGDNIPNNDLPNLLHIHGLIRDSQFIQAGLYRIGFGISSNIRNMFRKLLDRNNCLFVGFSGNDWDIYPELEDNLSKSNNKYFWLCLNKNDIGVNLQKLKEKFPNKVVLIGGDFDSFFESLKLKLNLDNRKYYKEIKEVDHNKTYKIAAEEFGKLSSCLSIAFYCSILDNWDDSTKWAELAEDIAYSNSAFQNQRAEILRLSSSCFSCAGIHFIAENLLSQAINEYQQTAKSSIAGVKCSAIIEYQFGLYFLCKNEVDLAEERLLKSLNILRTEKQLEFLIGKSEFIMLNVSVAALYGMLQAMISPNITDAIIINQQVYNKQIEARNLIGYCCTLLSLSLCYYRMKRYHEAIMALDDCIKESEEYGIVTIYNVAKFNKNLVNNSYVNPIDNKCPIIDKKTNWHLIPDVFSFYVQL